MRQSEAVGCSSTAQPNLENHTHGDSTGIDISKEKEIVRDDQPTDDAWQMFKLVK